MVRIIDADDRMFKFMPKGWFVIILTVFTLLTFLVYSVPLAGTDTYTAMMPYIFVVTFLFMLTFSPRDSWTNFKTAYFYAVPEARDKILAVCLSMAGLIVGYIAYWFLTSRGLVILAFPSGASLISMGTIFIISYFFIVAFYEEAFSIWFAGTIANNLHQYIGNKDMLWLISLIGGTAIWTMTHVIAVGFNLPSIIFIFSLGMIFRMVGYLAGKLQGKLYNSYFALFFHWGYDVFIGLYLAVIIVPIVPIFP